MDNNFALESFFELASEAMLVTDIHGVIKQHNPTAQTLIDQHSTGNGELTIQSLIKPQDICLIEESLEELQETLSVANLTVRLNSGNTKTQWFEWSVKQDTKSNCLYWMGRNVTEFKRKEAFLEILEEVTGTGVWELEPESGVLHWSKKIHEIHETDADEYEPVIEKALEFYDKEALPDLMAALDQQEKTGFPYKLNLPFVTAKNRKITVNARGFAQTRAGVVIRRYGTFKDITEEVETRLEKQKLTNRTSLALEVSKIGVWEYNFSTNTLIWDARMMEIYGVTPESFGGQLKDWETAVIAEDIDQAKAEFEESVKSGKQFISQFRIRTPDGQLRHIKALASNVYDQDNHLSHVVGVNMDYTDEITQRRQLEIAKEKSEAADRAKSRFLATISHEIRTPLNGVIGGLQIVQQQVLPAREQDIASKSLESARSLLGIINDILDYTKITENKIELDYLTVDVRRLLKQVIDEQSMLNEDADLLIKLDYHADTPIHYVTDPTRLRQIILNLISNAVKFTAKGEIVVGAKAVKMNGTTQLQLTVQDTGIGIAKIQLDKVFEPFSQADSSTTRKFGGTGLGLSIVKKLTSLMQGTIAVDSEVNQGTCFTLHFPFEAEQLEAETVANTDKPQFTTPDLSGKHVIIAEDNELNQILIDIMVQETGAEVTMVDDGKALVEMVTATDFDIVLCDINMPVMGGVEACKHIRGFNQSLPILAFTANVMEDDVQEYLATGFDDIVSKPVLREDLYNKLRRSLGN